MQTDSISLFKRGISLLSLLLFLTGCSPRLVLTEVHDQVYQISASGEKDEGLQKFLQPYKDDLDSQMNKVIATTPYEITKAKPEGLLNNLVADAMAWTGRQQGIPFDLAYTNYGGLRIGFPQGQVRMFSVFELMPFENLLTSVKFKGSDLFKLFEYMAINGGDPISGASFSISNKKPLNILIDGEPLDMERTYTVLTSDYMANGGDQAAFFSLSIDRKEHEVKLRDAILNYILSFQKDGKQLAPEKDGRIKIQ